VKKFSSDQLITVLLLILLMLGVILYRQLTFF